MSNVPVAGVDGNWACLGCSNINYAHRTVCNRCGAAMDGTGGNPGGAYGGAKRARGGIPVAGVDGNWSCGECSNINYAHRETCNRCNAGRSTSEWSADGGGNWNCPDCGNMNFPHRHKCNRCETLRPEQGMGAIGMGAMGMGGMGMGMGGMGMGMGGQPGRLTDPHEQGRIFLNCFMAEPNPLQAAMTFLSMNSNNASWFQKPSEPLYPTAPRMGSYGAYGATPGGGMPGGMPGVGSGSYASNKRARAGPNGMPEAGIDGNWSCAACQNVNFSHRTECNRCKNPRE